MGRQNQFNNFIHRYNNGKPFTEATATTALSRWLYRGHGSKYLSLPVCEDGVGRPADSGPRRFSCPTEGRQYAWWKPFQDHLQGDHKGLVIDDKTKSVPFTSVDLDRHSGDIFSADHQRVVVEAGRYLTKDAPHVKWLPEINPENGSAKFFGVRRDRDHFAKRELQKLSSNLREGLIQRGLCHNHNVEVFGDNCHAIWLPLRRDKISIGDDGRVHRCKRKILDERYHPERVFEDINVYSALYFLAWIDNGDNYHEETLIRALRHSCRNLKDEITSKSISVFHSSAHDGIVPSPAAREHAVSVPVRVQASAHQSNFESEPNAFKRNWGVLPEFVRNFYKRNDRQPTALEALAFLRENNLYSGRWEDNRASRRDRVAAILKHISKTFDPSLIGSNNQPIKLDHGIRRWCRCHFPNGLVVRRRKIDEMEMTSEIKTMVIPAKFVEHCVGVIAFCLNDHTENKALPTNRIKAVWNLVAGAPSWNQTYYKFVRLHLEKIGVIDIFDKNQKAGKAWRWSKGENFPAKMADKRTKKKKAGPSGSKRPNTEGVREGKKEKNRYNTLYQTLILKSKIGPQPARNHPPPSRDGPLLGKFHLSLSS